MNRLRAPLFALALLALLLGMWAGLLRMGWSWPGGTSNLPALHGPLMIMGFLGTLICLERAIAAKQRWAPALPLVAGTGSLLLLLGWTGTGLLLISLAAAGLTLLLGSHLRHLPTLYTAVMLLGAILWLVGNIIWLAGRPLHFAVWWWAGFLILTIAGERLELGRVLRHSANVRWLFGAATAVFMAGLLLTLLDYRLAVRVIGAGMLLIAVWLLLFDLARHNVRKPGVTGYIAISLLCGTIWLALSGVLAIWFGGVSAGPIYDAILHAILLGFVMSMIFGHAPIIFPAVLKRPLPYSPTFYLPLVLLQITLLTRVAADLLGWLTVRQWSGLLNALIILLFLGLMIAAIRRGAGSEAPKTSPV